MSMIFWIEHYREEYLIEVTTAKLSAPILKDICVHKYTNKGIGDAGSTADFRML